MIQGQRVQGPGWSRAELLVRAYRQAVVGALRPSSGRLCIRGLPAFLIFGAVVENFADSLTSAVDMGGGGADGQQPCGGLAVPKAFHRQAGREGVREAAECCGAAMAEEGVERCRVQRLDCYGHDSVITGLSRSAAVLEDRVSTQ